jgi:hypothetical protein
MTLVVLVPRRADNGIRDAIWQLLRPHWEQLGPVHEGHHEPSEGPFNRSRAINRAAHAAGNWTTALIIDADIRVDHDAALDATHRAEKTGGLAFAHTEWWGTTPERRDLVLERHVQLDDWRSWPDNAWQARNPLSNSCCMAVPRTLFDDIGGYDERFQGWGAEDWAWHVACQTFGGEITRGPDPVIHLHHPLSAEARAAHTATKEPPLLRFNHRLGRQYLDARGHPHKVRFLIRQAAKVRQP